MKIVRDVSEMRSMQSQFTRPIGLVPTMGALHLGHLSLVERARQENSCIVVSIFVNPTQFGPKEDYLTYPRDIDKDLALLDDHKVDILFAPDPTGLYPDGFDTWIDIGRIANRLEGSSRPGHFRGVATIVTKLFGIVKPDKAYFGQKDAQQVRIIERINTDLNLGVEVVAMPTVREEDGLAMSSRNVHLDNKQRQAAVVLYGALRAAKKMHERGHTQASAIKQAMDSYIKGEPLATVDYISVADPFDLTEVKTIHGSALVSLAVRIGSTRLIDNITLHNPHK